MKIGNNPQKQLYENTKDIEKLKSLIKEAYRTGDNVELNIASISVAKSLTNAGADVKDGWLFDSVGSLFKITGGDEDSLLLDFYSSLRGPQGEQGVPGAAVSIDDSNESLTKTWSSSKIASELANAGGTPTITIEPTQAISGGFRLTEEQYNIVKNNNVFNMAISGLDDVYSFVRTNYEDISQELTYICINYDGVGVSLEIKYLRIIPGTLEDEGKGDCYVDIDSFTKAKQLYQHNIIFAINSPDSLCNPVLEITNDISTAMTITDIKNYLTAKGYTTIKTAKRFTGYDYSGSKPIYNIYNDNGTLHYWGTDSGGPRNVILSDNTSINDIIEEL